MATFYALRWWGNGKLFAEKHLLYSVGGGTVYAPTVDLLSDDPTQFRTMLLFKDGAEASKFKYDHLRQFLDDTYKPLETEICRGVNQIELVPLEIHLVTN